MLKYLIGAIIAIILFIGGVFVGRLYYAKTEIKVIEKKVYETKWKTKLVYKDNQPVFDTDNFDRLLNCYDSDITFQDRIESNYLYITAQDNCKQAEARYKIGTKNNWTIYLTVGAIGVAAGATAIALLK